MKKFLSLVLLSTVACASLTAQTTTSTCFKNDTIAGFGSTVQGQTGTANYSLSNFVVDNFYDNEDPALTLTYNNTTGTPANNTPNNSLAGITNTILKPIFQQFGGTDVPPTAAQTCPNGPLLNWPVAVAGIVPYYNLPGQTEPLHFTAEMLAGIFAGHYATWGAVPGLNVTTTTDKNRTIHIVVRADASGSTNDFTTYLNDVLGTASPAWTLQGFGPFLATDWQKAYGTPVGTNNNYSIQTGTQAVINTVHGTTGAIGYVGYNNLISVYPLQIPTSTPFPTNEVGNVENPHGSGTFIPPNTNTFALAMQNVMSDPQLRYSTINSKVTGAYPIASPTNLVTLACQVSDCQAIELKKFLNFYITYAQNNGTTLGFGALPSSVVAQFIKQLDCLASSESCISAKVCPCCVDKTTGLNSCCTGGTCPSNEKPCPDRDRCKDKCKDKCR